MVDKEKEEVERWAMGKDGHVSRMGVEESFTILFFLTIYLCKTTQNKIPAQTGKRINFGQNVRDIIQNI